MLQLNQSVQVNMWNWQTPSPSCEKVSTTGIGNVLLDVLPDRAHSLSFHSLCGHAGSLFFFFFNMAEGYVAYAALMRIKGTTRKKVKVGLVIHTRAKSKGRSNRIFITAWWRWPSQQPDDPELSSESGKYTHKEESLSRRVAGQWIPLHLKIQLLTT